MALQTENWQDLCRLAILLRDSGDRVLSGNSKLRLTPALLSKLNAAFSSISLLGSNAGFQVTSAHASQPPTTVQLHFLHDFVQKTVGLTIAGNGNNQSDLYKPQAVDLSRFRSLRHLELRGCTVAHGTDGMDGLSPLRTQLEALVLLHIYQPDDLLWEVLADGAVAVGPDILWTKLSQLVASYCRLRSLGCGLSLACNLKWLDVSHNMLSDSDAVSYCLTALPKLSYLNLSFNRLSRIPVPLYDSSYPSPTKLQILLLSHNYIENLSGIQHLTSLRELNLEVNQLQDHSTLQPLRSLYQLQHLKLKGNPISYHKRHRLLASAFMPPRAVFLKHRYRRDTEKISPFMLDGHKLNEPELQAVRDGPLPSNLSKSEHVSIDVSVESDKDPESSGLSGSEMERSTRKSRKIREVIIEDFDTLDELTDKSIVVNQMTGSLESSGEHLQTKKQLEIVKAHFGQDWLRAQAGSTVQELLGIPSASSVRATGILGSSITSINSSSRPLSSSTPLVSPGHTPPMVPLAVPYPGHLDVQALESMILKRSPESKNHTDVTQTTQSTQYHTANDSDTVLQLSTANSESVSGENDSSDGTAVGLEGDGEEDNEDEINVNLNSVLDEDNEDLCGGDHSTYLVNEVIRGQSSVRDLFLMTTSRYIKEIEPSSGGVKQRWPLDSLESCVLLSASPCRIQLTFNTVVQSKKERIYEMDLNEAQGQLLPSLKAILETRSLTALNVAAFRCMRCSGEFSVELNVRKALKVCPTCGSSLVFELDEAPLPSLGSLVQSPPKPQGTAATESTRIPDPSSELLHSPSDSSIGSAASLESPGSVVQPASDYSSTVNTNLQRCESDIDIISNPSQSSIEVLDDVSRTSGTPGRKRSSEERQVVAVPSLLTVPEVSSPLAPLPAGLTESSSSGSLTDSVCTAYENNTGTGGMGLRRGGRGLANSVLREESSRENSPRYKEELENASSSTQPTSLSNVLDNLLQTMSSKISESESLEKKLKKTSAGPDSAIHYNYVDFSAVDHRLKLHLHLSILDADEREVVQLLLKGEVLARTPTVRYPGILLLSSQRLYLMKITGPEEGDRVDRWISRVVAIPRENLLSITALPWNIGIRLTLQGSSLNNLIMVLRDQHYTQNFFTFMKELPLEPNWKIEDTPAEKHSLAATGIMQNVVKDALPDGDLSVQLIVLLCSSVIIKDEDEQMYPGGLFVITLTGLVVSNDELSWLLPPENALPPPTATKCIEKQSISNLIQVEANGLELWLQFLDEAAGREEMWKLTAESEKVMEQIITAIRAPWEELFSVPLQVLQANKI